MSTAKFAVVGWPIKHSVSPQMQQAAFAALDIPAVYEKIPVPPPDLAANVNRLRDENYAGWNVTVPHKQDIIPLLDEVDSGARRACSVNTVLNRQGRLCGYSTDGYGLAMAIHESFGLESTAGRKFMFVGCGGAARACAVYFAAQGARELVLINRTLSKAESIMKIIALIAPDCIVSCLRSDQANSICQSLQNCDVLVQATSLGLHPDDALPLAPDYLPPRIAVMDMIYRQTPFLKAAAERGCRTADGRGMLLHQGARSFQLWTGKAAPVAIMRQALDAALQEMSTE